MVEREIRWSKQNKEAYFKAADRMQKTWDNTTEALSV